MYEIKKILNNYKCLHPMCKHTAAPENWTF